MWDRVVAAWLTFAPVALGDHAPAWSWVVHGVPLDPSRVPSFLPSPPLPPVPLCPTLPCRPSVARWRRSGSTLPPRTPVPAGTRPPSRGLCTWLWAPTPCTAPGPCLVASPASNKGPLCPWKGSAPVRARSRVRLGVRPAPLLSFSCVSAPSGNVPMVRCHGGGWVVASPRPPPPPISCMHACSCKNMSDPFASFPTVPNHS